MNVLLAASLLPTLLLTLALLASSGGGAGAPEAAACPPPFDSFDAASYHYGEKFAAAVRRFYETARATVSFDVVPASTELQQDSEQKQGRSLFNLISICVE